MNHSYGAAKRPKDCPFPPSELFGELRFTGKTRCYPNADTRYPSWASDGKCCSPFTDGVTEGVFSRSWTEVEEKDEQVIVNMMTTTGQAVIEGDDPMNLIRTALENQEASAYPYGGRYPCGSLVYNGIWYYGTYCLSPFGWTRYGGRSYNWPFLRSLRRIPDLPRFREELGALPPYAGQPGLRGKRDRGLSREDRRAPFRRFRKEHGTLPGREGLPRRPRIRPQVLSREARELRPQQLDHRKAARE